ncbi:MAG: hypothetical protein ACI94Y_000278 [Maribacter sp.]|jgi:hypothetical protein
MTNFRRSFFWLVMLYIATIACNDPNNIGSELVESEFSDIKFTDTITVTTLNTTQESIFTYTNNIANQPGSYLCGNIDELVFGSYKASVYIDFLLNSTSVVAGDRFEGATFDSLVLSLAYDSLRTYGDTLISQTLDVGRLIEPMDGDVEFYYSNENFGVDPTSIGGLVDFLPHPRTSVTSITDEDTTLLAPHIRIPLSEDLATELMNYDSTTYANSENFQAVFNGIKVASTVDNANILGFNLQSALSYMRLYYTVDEVEFTFTYTIGGLSVKYNEFEHDYTGSIIEPFIDNQEMSDSLVFCQGMSGTNVKIDFPYINTLEEVIVNKADLEFTMAYLPGDDTIFYAPPVRVVLAYLSADGNYYFIDDVTSAIATGNVNAFGGNATTEDENGVFVQKYKMNISNYLQEIIECTDVDGFQTGCLSNTAESNSLYMQVYLKNQYASRGVMYGGDHSQYPAKLDLIYTQQ